MLKSIFKMSQAGEHHAFILLKIFKKNGESYTAAVRNTKNQYKQSRHNHVLTRNSVILRVNNFKAEAEASWKTVECSNSRKHFDQILNLNTNYKLYNLALNTSYFLPLSLKTQMASY